MLASESFLIICVFVQYNLINLFIPLVKEIALDTVEWLLALLAIWLCFWVRARQIKVKQKTVNQTSDQQTRGDTGARLDRINEVQTREVDNPNVEPIPMQTFIDQSVMQIDA